MDPDNSMPDSIEDRYCRTCGYSLLGLAVCSRCPECGQEFNINDPKTFRRRPRRGSRFYLAFFSIPVVGVALASLWRLNLVPLPMSQAECVQCVYGVYWEGFSAPITRAEGWKWLGDPWGAVRIFGHRDRLQAVFVFEEPEAGWHEKGEWLTDVKLYCPDGAMFEHWQQSGPYWRNPDSARDFHSEWEAFVKQ